jgi:hypothetical protein
MQQQSLKIELWQQMSKLGVWTTIWSSCNNSKTPNSKCKKKLEVQNARTEESFKLDEMNSPTKSVKMTTHKTSNCE